MPPGAASRAPDPGSTMKPTLSFTLFVTFTASLRILSAQPAVNDERNTPYTIKGGARQQTAIEGKAPSQASREKAAEDEAALEEDPESVRPSEVEASTEEVGIKAEPDRLELYASARFYGGKARGNFRLTDNGTRFGLYARKQITPDWWAFGRAEAGFNLGGYLNDRLNPPVNKESRDVTRRLLLIGVDSDHLMLKAGKSWSTYYTVGGVTDRFSVFGGSASGVYNAGTDGGASGTGRAENSLQGRLYIEPVLTKNLLNLKPYNLNLQYQNNEPIPQVEGRHYGKAFGVSTWLESRSGKSIGLAYNYARIDDRRDPRIRAAGIDGNDEAFIAGLRWYGQKWYAGATFSHLKNHMTTDENRYINADGMELYTQYEFTRRWWLVAGGNYLRPDPDDPDAGEYQVLYGVLGLRYAFDSFNRMVYLEAKLDKSRNVDGSRLPNVFLVGVRWDLEHLL
jgi:outer membrane protein N